ncbi:MAG: hypothetical protein IJY04_03345 [Clostridia bacterium]|nr:hypothetical protein [Clostridia bacterium]
MKKIGFIDFYLSEWHANNYPVWIDEINRASGEDFRVAYAWAELDTSPKDGTTTDEWCEKFGAKKCASIKELCRLSDYVLILAPSDPEKHLIYARQALTCGKPTYIDKTFAPNSSEAAEMFRIAEENCTPLFTSSALRYASELSPYEGKICSAIITGGGSGLEEYVIHQLEMAVKLMGTGAREVYLSESPDTTHIAIRYGDHRSVNLFYSPALPFTAALTNQKGETVTLPISSDYFRALLSDILRFYREGTLSFPREQTMEIMKLREAIIKSKATAGTAIPL